ncbi:MAG: tRNA (adenosine(37)-N6)-dimethylallyltransferase MiaA [Pseudomonadota bacterium]
MSEHDLPPAIFLMGPTAAGKTALAAELVRRFPLEIISVDSALVYRGMDIGTAKPGPALLREAPHRLIDIREPTEPYSAAEFRADALAAMHEIGAHGRVPLLVGGTFLYFRALQQGLSPLPAADPAVRATLQAELAGQGLAALHRRLAAVDPATAARLHANDTQRILRALEVYEMTGKPMSELLARGRGAALPTRVLKLALMPADRALLHARIEARFAAMLAAGFEAEVRTLMGRGDLTPELPALRAVGYRQMWEYLAGGLSREEMLRKITAVTRQYARRQLTWLRSERDAEVFAPEDPATPGRIAARVAEVLARV